jgi:Family of unknown function (DUF6328)
MPRMPEHRDRGTRTADETGSGAPGRRETAAERLDRNYNELLQELRVAQTGVQILFAFLLSLPFLQGFRVEEADRRLIYSGTLLSAALAAGLLIAPVPYHRLVFRANRKEEVVRMADRMAVLGMGFLLVAMTGSLFLVFDELWSAEVASLVAAGFAGACLALWFVLPVLARRAPALPSDDGAGTPR